MSDFIVEASGISYMYPSSKEPVLKDIDFKVKKGEFVGLIGPTGAGKSTLCLALNGIVPQFYGGRFFGNLKIAGLDTLETSVSELSQHIGIVFEEPETQITSTSVENEVAFALENQKVPREEILQRIKYALEVVRMTGMERRHPYELSGGQKQRLAIASALALQPQLLVLDEPTSQLDPVGTTEIFQVVKELNRDLGITVIMVSHAAEEMAEYTGRVLLLSDGVLLADEAPNAVYGDLHRLVETNLRAPLVTSCFYSVADLRPGQPPPVTIKDGLHHLQQLAHKNHPKPFVPSIRHIEDAPAKDATPLLQTKDLTHVYDDGFKALKNVNLSVERGEYVLIVGQNGAGKSTLVKHFLKLLVPTGGDVLIAGQSTKDLEMSDLAKSIGYVAQNPDNQIFNTSVEKEITFALNNLGYEPEEVQQRLEESLTDMGLTKMREAHPLSLPKGDRARVVIAAILAMKPEILIFDEPTTGQDYQGAKFILDISRRLNELGKTVIVITHHLYLMPEYAKRVIVMSQGGICLDTSLRDAFYDCAALEEALIHPIQSVELGEALGRHMGDPKDYRILTNTEFSSCFAQNEG